jgi:threonyl-tRNA synthetase
MAEKIKVRYKNKEIEVEKGTPIGKILEALNIKGAIGAKVKPLEEIKEEKQQNEEILSDSKASESGIYDVHTPLEFSAEIKPIYKGSEEGLEIMRHTLAHILAQALSEIYGRKNVHLGIGPTTDTGFFYDVEIEGHHLKEEDLPKIEEKMREIVKRKLPIERIELSREEAKKLFSELGEKYKLQIIDRIPEGQPITIYKQGDFIDLCRGPHLPTTGDVGEFKLSHIAGAYWMGRSDQPMLQRIYGIAFWSKKDLKNYLQFLEEVKKRDHRRLGKELEFFTIDENVGPGLILWLPRGALYRKLLEDFLREEHYKRGYQFVYTPHVGRSVLWETSGHLEFYKENMFPPMEMDNETYYVKPMNCPFHIAIYKSRVRSYKELPLRFFELGTVYRYELSGVLHGLMRVRGFTQDDAHIICTEEQVESEIKNALKFALDILKVFGFKDFKV